MSYRRAEEAPLASYRPVTAQAGQRVGDIFEVEPALMSEHVHQQQMPTWDTLRIAGSRAAHLDWMHRHWAGLTVSGQALLDELECTAAPASSLTSIDPSTSETRS